MALWILFLCLIKCVQCRNDYPYISEDDFEKAEASGETFSVYLFDKADTQDQAVINVLDSIKFSQSDLEMHNIKLKILNCENSRIPICQRPEGLNHVIVYKAGDVVATINGDNLQTMLEVQTYMKHHALLENVQEITNKEEYAEIQKQYVGMADLAIFYITSLGTTDHLKMVNLAAELPKQTIILYTSNKTLFDDKNKVWFVNCLSAEDGECPVSFSADSFDSEDLRRKINKLSSITVLPQDANYAVAVRDMVNKGQDILILIAGARKLVSAVNLANEVTSLMKDGIHAVVVDGVNIHHHDIKTKVEDDKIFALASPGTTGYPKYIDIGFLEMENPDDVIAEFTIAMSVKDEVEETNVNDDDDDDDYHRFNAPEDVQDDPMAFSLHRTSHVRDLYYLDYKTIPRLTDKTYEKVTQSKNYAVILFTLEFNSKALATLMNFIEIHTAFKEMGESPLYRVECYNWPDVCEKAMVYTSPRMFFYPFGSTERIEYDGLWDKVSMKEAIVRYSNPTVIVVRKKEDILPYLPITARSVVGFFESDEGTPEFRKAAKTLRKEFQFIEIHDAVAKFVAEQYDIDYEDRRLIAFEHSFPKQKLGKFHQEKDILDFCKEAFAAPELQQLTIYSFVEVLGDEKPLLIYFWDTEDEDKRPYYTEIKDTIQNIASERIFADKILFTWMESSEKTTGQFVLERYNYRSNLEKPIVAYFDKKGSVILRSCETEDCRNASLVAWLQDCIDGKMKATYSLSTDEWKPRLEGYNYLEMMKKEGTYPDNLDIDTGEEESAEPVSRGGRAIADMVHKQKKMTEEKKSDEKTKKVEVEQNLKESSTIHSEL